MAPGHAEVVEQNFYKKIEVTEDGNNYSYSRQMYDNAAGKIATVVDAVSTPLINPKELACLARNIFFEAANEPEEGMVAVGLVTLNRTTDGRFKSTVCGVVEQKLVLDIPKTQIITRKSIWGDKAEKQTIWSRIGICQFSWRCMFVKDPKSQDERWLASQRIAQELLADGDSYSEWRSKYAHALYFHSTGILPVWAHQKEFIGRIGGHKFYEEQQKVAQTKY
jgi:spore germination cell wall hydrolase CwlJ-like protein